MAHTVQSSGVHVVHIRCTTGAIARAQVKFADMRKELRLGTVPAGATEETVRTNNPSLYRYMRQFNVPDVDIGITALKEQYSYTVHTVVLVQCTDHIK